jgi:hypothetical protein
MQATSGRDWAGRAKCWALRVPIFSQGISVERLNGGNGRAVLERWSCVRAP